jgi:hypothetical protein
MKKFNLLLAALGVAVFLHSLGLGWESIWEQIENRCHSAGGSHANHEPVPVHFAGHDHSSSARRVPFFELFRIRLAGEAINYLIPSGTLGGEPSKPIY